MQTNLNSAIGCFKYSDVYTKLNTYANQVFNANINEYRQYVKRMKTSVVSTSACISVAMYPYVHIIDNVTHCGRILLISYCFDCRIKEMKADLINFHQATLAHGCSHLVMCASPMTSYCIINLFLCT